MDSSRHLGINVSDVSREISNLRRDIHTSLARSIKDYEDLESSSLATGLLPELPDWLSKLQYESISLQKQVDIISSLHYSRISERERNVKDPHPKTYDWLFENPETACESQSASNVLEWLSSGNGCYAIAGKAGCGKSVLMKYLYNHPKTRAALKEWAAGKDLVVAGFFFWSAGTSMQKSQQGLLQSLLMCILKQRPALIPHLCPDRWNARLRVYELESWTKSELLEALAKLKADSVDSARFCIFIDGMDEYEGEMLDLLHLFKDLTTSGSIKICVSSRPWTVFNDFFGDNGGKKIILQHLNRSDIWRFAYEQITGKMNNRSNLITKTEYLTLVDEIVERSSGVFLWVFLVVRSLLRGMSNLDTGEELRTRLRELPTELEEFFRRILDRGDRVYDRQAARLYLIQMNANDGGLTTHDIAPFAEEDRLYALRDSVCSRHAENAEHLDEVTRTRVLARCQDLLEFDDDSKLQFLHRTVKDFLETRDILDELTRRAGEGFNGHLFICNSMLLQMKLFRRDRPRASFQESIATSLQRLMHAFWHHTRQLAKAGQLCAEFIVAFDETFGSLYSGYYISDSFECSHKGWLLDMAVDWDVPEILSLRIDKVELSVLQNQIWRKPPLEKALICMRSKHRLTTIRDLLRHGADPNEVNWENISVWKSYLDQFKWLSRVGGQCTEIDILEELLHHGADTSLLFNNSAESYEILSKCNGWAGYMDADRLERFEKFQRQVVYYLSFNHYLSFNRPELPMRPNKRVLDSTKEQPYK